MSEVIVHEYHYPGGPQTYEYPIGSPIPTDHLNCMSPLVRDTATQPIDSVRELLASSWSDLHHTVAPIGTYLLSLKICSVAFTESSGDLCQSWIVFRGSNSDQCLLGSPSIRSAEILNAAWIAKVTGLQHLLTAFGNLQVGMIPPCSGFYVGDRLTHESDNELCWGPTGKWENALPIFHDGSGNSICVSTDGAIGIWSPHQFQCIAASLPEFVTMFVNRQRSGQSPQTEWWW